MTTLAALFAQCAHVEAPSGGKVDKVPPQVKGVYPARSQTGVPLNTPIKVVFTEWMNENLGPADIQISPPVLGGLEWEMQGDELEIRPRSPLDSGTTYTLLMSRDLKDLRNNPLDLPFSLTFSTGSALDSLTLSGQVLSSQFKNPPSSTRLGLYLKDPEKRSHFQFLTRVAQEDSLQQDTVPRLWREFPLYQTSPDSSGLFTFKGLAPGHYRLAAFVDGNRNGLINQEYEEIALYHQDLVLTQAETLKHPLVLSKLEKVPFLITGIQPLGPHHVEIKFNNPLQLNFDTVEILTDSSSIYLDSNQWILRPSGRILIMQFDSLLNGSTYTVNTKSFSSIFGETLDSLQWKFPFTWQSLLLPDKNPIAESSVRNGSTLYEGQNAIDFHYTYPYQVLKGDSLFLISQRDTLTLQPQLTNAFTRRIKWDKPLSLSTNYQIVQKIPPNDSLPEGARLRLLNFSTPDPLKVGYLTLQNKNDEWISLSIRHLEEPFSDSLELQTKQSLTLGPLPEGPILITYYKDLNKNHRRELGSIHPYEVAEPVDIYPDTLIIPRSDTLLISIPR